MPDVILAQAVVQLFSTQSCFTICNMPKSEKGDNSAKYLQNFAKNKSGHLYIGYNLYAKYHDPSSRGSLNILFTKS